MVMGLSVLSVRCVRAGRDSYAHETSDGHSARNQCGIKGQCAAEHAVSAGFDEVERWDSILSNHKEDSELSQLNSNPRQGVVSDDMFHFVSTARYWSERTNGAFDVTVEPLTRLWHLRERTLDRIPANKEIAAARACGVPVHRGFVVGAFSFVFFRRNGAGHRRDRQRIRIGPRNGKNEKF